MRIALLFSLVIGLLAAVSLPLHAEETSAKSQIRKLIPSAAAMKKADFEKLANSPTGPRATDIKEQSLTLMLLSLPLAEEPDEEKTKEFQYLGEGKIAKPADIAREIYRSAKVASVRIPLGPATAIHADRITKFTCETEGDSAQGTVSFQAPKLYQGKVNYVAARKDDTWQITEFLLPAHGVHIVRGDQGIWQKK